MIKLVLIVLFSCACACASENTTECDFFINLDEDSQVQITYNNKGTRSEGQTGKLLIKGIEIVGTNNETRIIGGIKITWYGLNRDLLWLNKGWNYADVTKIIPSYKIQTTAQPVEAPVSDTPARPETPSTQQSDAPEPASPTR